MSNNHPADRNPADAVPSVMYTHHGAKHKQGYPVKIYGRNALAYFKGDELDGFTFQEEINAAFEDPGIPNYEPPL